MLNITKNYKFKTTVQLHLMPIRMATINNKRENANHWWECREIRTLVDC
jgi:hypothetical protein